MAAGKAQSRRFLLFKYTVYGLLALNIALFLIFGAPHEAMNSLGWMILLGSFEYETAGLDEDYASPTEKYLLWSLQIVGYALALYATWSYWRVEQWPDLLNAVTWLCVCAAIAYDVHVPGEYGGLEWRIRNIVKGALYLLLFAVAVWWAYEGLIVERDAHGLLEFYDAILWIVCFGVIELNVFASETEEDATSVA